MGKHASNQYGPKGWCYMGVFSSREKVGARRILGFEARLSTPSSEGNELAASMSSSVGCAAGQEEGPNGYAYNALERQHQDTGILVGLPLPSHPVASGPP